MKKVLALFGLILLTTLTASLLVSGTMAVLTGREVKIEKLHKTPLALPPIAIVTGDSVYVTNLELKGKWEETKKPAHPWPYEAFKWFDDDRDDDPLAKLDWTGVTVDTTWGVADLGGGVGKYTIDKKATQEYKAGKFLAPTLKGWLAPTNVYTVEVYAVKGAAATLVKTLPFNPAGKDTAFSGAKWEVAYKAEGRGVYPAATPARPDTLINAKAEAKVQFNPGLKSQWFQVPDGTDSLRFVFKNQNGAFAAYSAPVTITTQQQLGVNPSVVIKSQTPVSGYFSAGDTIDVELTLKNNAGDVLQWWTNPQALGIEKMEILVSGPKRDYEWVFPLRNVIEKYAAKYDSVQQRNYTGNPVKIVLPKTLPNGNGTYTVFASAKRIFGTTEEKAALADFQVGAMTVDNLPVTSKIAGQSCATCHGVDGPAKHHGAKGAEQCLPCHTDNFKVGFDEWAHVKHQNNHKVNLALADCNACHVNDSHNQFTSDAPEVCTSCHGVVPYMPADHAATVPLYSTTGLSCATANCHAGGTLGVFKNIKDTHAGIATKYASRTIAARKTPAAPVIDGVAESRWNVTDSLITKTGVKVKFLYDNDNLYVLAQWKDGHQNYSGAAPATKSLARNRWTYDGTKWTKAGNEDRIAFLWKIDDALGASCAQTCHDPGAGHKMFTGKADNWHWKAQRSNPLGYSDDQYWDTSGRKNDAATAGTFGTDNADAAGALPIKMGANAADNAADFLYESKAVAFVNSGWTAGQSLPGWIVNDASTPAITGSRADVQAVGQYNDATGVWTVEFKRARNTGNADDALFDGTVPVEFVVTQFDNTGSGHASQGVDVSVYKLEFSTTGVLADREKGVPAEYALAQNYPNPFNPSTTIAFAVKQRGNVTLRVYDATGRLVETLVNEEMDAGHYTAQFNAAKLVSGIYFYRLQAGAFASTKKLVLVK